MQGDTLMKKLIIFLAAITGGVGASQFPEFTQQYEQRLGGAVNELDTIIEQFDNDARASGLSREEAVDRYGASGDDFLTDRGVSIKRVMKRHERLSAHLKNMQQASPFERLWVFASEQDAEISEATMQAYQPAVPVTAEGAAHAAGGAVGGWAILGLLLAPFGRRRKRAAA